MKNCNEYRVQTYKRFHDMMKAKRAIERLFFVIHS